MSNSVGEVWATILFLSGNHAQEIHTHQCFIFFSAIYTNVDRTTVCQDPDILLPWQHDVTTFILYTPL